MRLHRVLQPCRARQAVAGEACTVREEGLEDQTAGGTASAAQRKAPAAADRKENGRESDGNREGRRGGEGVCLLQMADMQRATQREQPGSVVAAARLRREVGGCATQEATACKPEQSVHYEGSAAESGA
jgi:hypothetical protein